MAGHDHKSHDREPILEKEKISPDDQYSGRHWINRHLVNSADIQSSANFLSKNSAGQISISSSSSVSNEKLSATNVTRENFKCFVVSTQSSNSIPSRDHVPSKSDISSELGPLVQRGSGMDAVKSEERQKHMTESSCSNSVQITHPVSSSNDSCLDMSAEMRSAKPHTLGVNSSTSEGFGSSMEELVRRGIVSDIVAQSSQKVLDNSREGIELKVPELARKKNVLRFDVANNSISSLHQERNEEGVGQVKEQFHKVNHALGTARSGAKGITDEISKCRDTSENIDLNKEINGPAVYASFSHLGNSNKSSCRTETKKPAATFSRKCEGRGSSYLEIVDEELMNQQLFSNAQHPFRATHSLGKYELNGLNNRHKSTKSANAPSSDIDAKGLPAHHDLFDLNEDGKELDSHVESSIETGNPFNVIRVVAKPGVPSSVLMTHRKLEGEMSWKGSAATSAFHPTNWKLQDSQSDSAPTFSKGFAGIDLNVAAAEDDDDSELHLGLGRTSGPLIVNPAFKVSCSKAERLDFDLNCLGDIVDVSQDASLLATSVKTEIADFNSNEGSSIVDKYDDCHWQNKPTSQHFAKLPPNAPGIPYSTNSGSHGDLIRPAYPKDFSNIKFYNHSQIQPFMMASPYALRPVEQSQKVVQLQPKLPFAIPSLTPQGYPSGGPFFVYPNGLVTSNLHYPTSMQYARDPRVHADFPQNISHTMAPSVVGGQHFMQVVHRRSLNEGANIRPCIDIGNGGISVISGSPSDTRQFFPPSKCSPVEEQIRVPLKRTEPEGGHD